MRPYTLSYRRFGAALVAAGYLSVCTAQTAVVESNLYFKPAEAEQSPSEWRVKKVPDNKKASVDSDVPLTIHSVGKEPAVKSVRVPAPAVVKPSRSPFLGGSPLAVGSSVVPERAKQTSKAAVSSPRIISPAIAKKTNPSKSAPVVSIHRTPVKAVSVKTVTKSSASAHHRALRRASPNAKYSVREKIPQAVGNVWFLSDLQVTGHNGKKQVAAIAALLASDSSITGIRLVGYAGEGESCGGMPSSQLAVARALTVRKELSEGGISESLIRIRQPEVVPGDKDKRYRVDVYVVRAVKTIQ